MTQDKTSYPHTRQARWARFRFSIIGPLLSAPPEKGNLKKLLRDLAKKQWVHPIKGTPISFGASTLERWFYQARKNQDPVNALRTKLRKDTAYARKVSSDLKTLIQSQYNDHPSWSYQLHRDNLAVRVKDAPELGIMPSYSTVYRYMRANGLRKKRVTKQHHSRGEHLSQERREQREVRSYEMICCVVSYVLFIQFLPAS